MAHFRTTNRVLSRAAFATLYNIQNSRTKHLRPTGQTRVTQFLPNHLRYLLCLLLIVASSACVYEVEVQQGNKLEPQDIEAVEVGMTRSQVRYLLGTPVVNNLFRDNRWDYVYFFKAGRAKKVERRWMVVWFEEDVVAKIERDLISPPDDDEADS